jgi:hypothetical protein
MAEGKGVVFFNNKKEGYLGLLADYLGDIRKVPIALAFLPRLLTSPLRSLPDFIVIGFPKCGTTSLYEYLVGHPSIGSAFGKETFFFDHHHKKGLFWYRAYFPTFIHRLFDSAFICGEATAAYSTHPETYKRIFDANPKARIIVLLRNPVERAYSNYRHLARLGHERSFEQTIDDNLEGKRYERHTTFHDILASGAYAGYLEKLFGVFPRGQVLVLSSDEFFTDPDATVKKCFSFLGVRMLSLKEYRKFNPGGRKKEMGQEAREKLERFYRPHNKRLYELLGRDFGW